LNDIPAPNLIQKETWRDVNVNPDMSKEEQEQIWKLVKTYQTIFSDFPTAKNMLKYAIKLKSDEVIRHKPYKIPVHLSQKVEDEISKMLDMHCIG
jgi:hypothetical protein